MKGDTELKGGAITSTEKALQDHKNTFTTGGRLTTSDIQNSAHYSADAIGATLGTSQLNDGTFKPAGNSAGIGSDQGSASSTTQAGITGIAGNTAARTGDAETGIQKIFDAGKVQQDIDAQVLITRTFGAQASKAVGDYAKTQIDAARQLKADAAKESDPNRKTQLEQQAQQLENDWGDNGTQRILAHTVIGGLMGGAPGAAGTAVGTLTAPAVADALKAAGIDGPLATALTAIASTASGAAAGGTAGAAGSFNEVANNYLDHKRPSMMRLSEKERYENAVTACDKQDSDACRTKTELAQLSFQRDLALAQACSGSTPDLCNQKAQEAVAMGNIVQSSNGQFVYANSPESGPIRYLNTATIGIPTRPDSFHDQVAKSTSEALLIEGQNVLIGAVVNASLKGVTATNAAIKDYFAAKGTGEVIADAGSVKGVNPTGSMQNCTNCVAVVDNLLTTGNPASALPRATPVPFSQLGEFYGTTLSGWGTQQSIESSLLAGGNGTRAVIYGTDGTTGHVWNAVVQNGRINYIDGQIGGSGAANFQSFSHFQFGILP